MIKGVHEPIVSETLFYKVQSIVNTPKKVVGKRDELKAAFPIKAICFARVALVNFGEAIPEGEPRGILIIIAQAIAKQGLGQNCN